MSWRTILIPLLLPAVLLAVAALLVLGDYPPARTVIASLPYAPYVILLGGMLISAVFHYGRAFFVFSLLALVHWGLADGALSGDLASAALALLVPFNVLLFVVLRERGVLSSHGALRAGLVIAQLGLMGWLLYGDSAGLGRYLHYEFLPPAWVDWTAIAQPGLAFGLLAALVLAGVALRGGSALAAGFLSALAGVLLALHAQHDAVAVGAFMALGGLFLLAALVQDFYGMAYLDELTGLPARRALNNHLLRLGSRYAIAMVDVDHFKKFNDTYGHDVGDQVLRFVASKLRRVGGGGKAFRYGGEEFTVLFAGRSVKQVLPYLDALREDIAASGFALRAQDRPQGKGGRKAKAERGQARRQTVSITVSMGAAEKAKGDALTPEQVMEEADTALYRAKREGRNRVAC